MCLSHQPQPLAYPPYVYPNRKPCEQFLLKNDKRVPFSFVEGEDGSFYRERDKTYSVENILIIFKIRKFSYIMNIIPKGIVLDALVRFENEIRGFLHNKEIDIQVFTNLISYLCNAILELDRDDKNCSVCKIFVRFKGRNGESLARCINCNFVKFDYLE